eukprot:scaffold5928_cov87-Phaeocystis_antarctica.AAC.2
MDTTSRLVLGSTPRSVLIKINDREQTKGEQRKGKRTPSSSVRALAEHKRKEKNTTQRLSYSK